MTEMEGEAYDKIDETGEDWVNNDGGFGELRYDLIDGKWYSSMSINQRWYSTTLVHEHTNEPVEEEGEDE